MIEDRHTLVMRDSKGLACPLVLNEKILSAAPVVMEDAIGKIRLCTKFLEQFKLSGHFSCKPGAPLHCYAVADIGKTVDEVFGSAGDMLDPTGGLPPSLVLSVYAGLVRLTDSLSHLNINVEHVKFIDSTAEIDWTNHVVLCIEYREKPTDVMYVIPIFKRTDNEVLRLVGSYDPYNEEIHEEKGAKLDASKGVEERFRKLYGKRDLNRKVEDMGGKSKGN